MTLEEKLKRANSLKEEIDRIKDFKNLCQRGNEWSEKYQKHNEFCSIILSAKIWTGSDNPRYEQALNYLNEKTITRIVERILPVLVEDLSRLEEELNNIIR